MAGAARNAGAEWNDGAARNAGAERNAGAVRWICGATDRNVGFENDRNPCWAEPGIIDELGSVTGLPGPLRGRFGSCTGLPGTCTGVCRTAIDFARFLKRLHDEVYPGVSRVVLVTDNLNAHCVGSLYEAFDPAEALRLAKRIEWHYTPEHGSWPNMAEVELSVLARQCLDRRIPDAETLEREVAAWQHQRNTAAVKADWQFTTADARVKLKKLYPTVQVQ